MQAQTVGKIQAARGKKTIATPLLLGVPDGPIPPEDDIDPYVTKLGGVPVWFDATKLPSSSLCTCNHCRQPMYLLFQGYVPLPDSIYERIMYVWACNHRACMRKKGSISVVRSQKVDRGALEAQRRKEQEQKKREQMNKKPAFGTPSGFQLGDLWGAGPSFSAAPQIHKDTQIDTLAGKIKALQLENNNAQAPKTATIATNPVDTTTLPKFPGEYLYVFEETSYGHQDGHDKSGYQKYMDLETNVDLQATSSNGEWQGEVYEQQKMPRGVDKQFGKFTERVELEPSQCVRYEWNGDPLLYCQPREPIANSRCGACGSSRVFEFQLMPNILSILPTVEYAASAESGRQHSNTKDPKAILNSWSVGIDFGTILVYVCKDDCHPGEPEEVSYVEEESIVQYELE